MTMKIAYYPDATREGGGGTMTIEEIDVGEAASGLEPYGDDIIPTHDTVDGAERTVSPTRGRLGVLWTQHGVRDAAIARAVRSMESHLRRGGVIALAGDATRAWAGYPLYAPQRDDTVVRTDGNPWSGLWSGSPSVSSGDVVVVSSETPEAFRSAHLVSSLSTTTGTHRLTLSEAIVYTPRLGVLVREEHFYPALRLDVERQGDEPIIVSRSGRHLVFDVECYLVEAWDVLSKSRKVPDGGYAAIPSGDNQGYSF